jgi:hypothetical protein
VYLLHRWPAMQEVAFAFRWGNSEEMGQQISALYPHGIPRIIITGVVAYHCGIKEAINEQHKRAIDEAKSKSKP